MSKKVALLIGSLRSASYNRKFAKKTIELAPADLEMEIVEIGDLPFYNEDLDNGNPPEQWSVFREKIKAVDGVIFFTPEYNRSIPAVLKNAIEVASRPPKQSAWNGKVGAVVSITPGALGAFGANHILRQSMVSLNVIMLQQPEAYISNVAKLFTEDGELVDATKEFMIKFLDAYKKLLENQKD